MSFLTRSRRPRFRYYTEEELDRLPRPLRIRLIQARIDEAERELNRYRRASLERQFWWAFGFWAAIAWIVLR